MSRRAATSFKLPHGSMPAIGLGTWQSKPGETAQAVKREPPNFLPAEIGSQPPADALQNGYRHIDTAFIYMNEREVGEGIAQSGVKREDVWLTTKLWNAWHRPEDVEKGLDLSLQRLGVDYVDLYLMHFPIAFQAVEGKGGKLVTMPKGKDGKVLTDFELSENFMPTWRAMEELVNKGKARHIGICNFNERRLAKLLKDAKLPPAVLQIEQNPGFYTPRLIKYAQDRGIVVQAYSALGSTGAAHRNNIVVKRLAERHHCDPAQILISWPLNKNLCVLPKSVTPSRIEANLKTIDLTDEEVAELDREAANTPTKRSAGEFIAWGVDVDEGVAAKL